jgi:Protein of unknown function (DUF2599)
MTNVRRLIAATMVATAVPLALTPVASANPVPAPPFIDHVEWAKWGDLSSLRVFPTQSARSASGLMMGTAAEADVAWAEVLALSPDADIPGMKAQFVCHWKLAEYAEPGKVSWNLEPWRPEVDDNEMVSAGCNPGGTEEPF